MKKQLLMLLFLLPLTILAQTLTVPSVLGVPLGCSRQNMISIMKAKGYDQKLPVTKNPSFTNVKFGAFNGCDVVFYFTNDKLFQCLIILSDGLDAKVIDRYNDLNEEISKKYGHGESFKSFKSPYKEGDGYEVSAIKLGKAEYNTFWSIDNLIINSSIHTNLLISIKYQDSILVKEAIEEKDRKNTQEY